MKGGKPGSFPSLWGGPFMVNKMLADTKSPAARAVSLDAELKNGRLAMLGIASFYFAQTIKGSVPLTWWIGN